MTSLFGRLVSRISLQKSAIDKWRGLVELSWTGSRAAYVMASTSRRTMGSDVTLEECVTTLEKLVDELMHKAGTPVYKKDWRCTVGMFDGDPVMPEILAEGQRIRHEEDGNLA